tara:strand:+ start:1712 stop:2734 length:1023 start_codon:yes stop_codon:yes gene_type:complete
MSLPIIGGTNTGGPPLVDLNNLPSGGVLGGVFQGLGNQINQGITAQYQANQPNQNLASIYNYVTVRDGQVFFNPDTTNLQFINAVIEAGLVPKESDQTFLRLFFQDSTDNWLVRRFNDPKKGYDLQQSSFPDLNDSSFQAMMRLQNALNPFMEATSLPASGIFLDQSFQNPYSPDNPPPPGVTYSGRPVFIGQAPSGRIGGSEGVFYTKEDVLLRQDEMPSLYNPPPRTMPADDQESRLPEDDTVTTMASGGIVSLAMNSMDMPTGQGIETFLNRDRSKAALQRNLQMLAQQQQMQQQQMMAQQGMPPGMPPQGMMPPGPRPMPPGPRPTMQQGIMPMAG